MFNAYYGYRYSAAPVQRALNFFVLPIIPNLTSRHLEESEATRDLSYRRDDGIGLTAASIAAARQAAIRFRPRGNLVQYNSNNCKHHKYDVKYHMLYPAQFLQ